MGRMEGGRYGGEESKLIGDDVQQTEGADDEMVESEGSEGDGRVRREAVEWRRRRMEEMVSDHPLLFPL